MKKIVLSVAVAACWIPAVSFAQSSVTLYGVLDNGLVWENGGGQGAATKLGSGVNWANRFGVRGSEDLGHGLSAIFDLEGGFDLNSGQSAQANSTFGRASFVGLKGDFGTIVGGRYFTPYFVMLYSIADPFSTGMAGDSNNLMATTGYRMNNAVKYTSPNMGGFVGTFAYSFGGVPGDFSAGRAYGGTLTYSHGPLNIGVAYHDRSNDTATLHGMDDARNTLLAANYDFRLVKVYLAYGIDKGPNSSSLANANAYNSPVAPIPSTDSTSALVGLSIPFGRNRILASYIYKNDKSGNNQNAEQFAIGYTYQLSKRTQLYSAYAYIRNFHGAGYTVGNSSAGGSGNQAFNLGLVHTF